MPRPAAPAKIHHICEPRHTEAKSIWHTLHQAGPLSAERFMTSIGTDAHVDSQPQSFLRRGGEKAFTLTFPLAIAAATLGWFYLLARGTVAVASWLLF
jgi:hypothetical protein